MTEHILYLSAPTGGAYETGDGRISLELRPGMWWKCSCGHWVLRRNSNTGSPFLEGAKRQHRKHVKETQ